MNKITATLFFACAMFAAGTAAAQESMQKKNGVATESMARDAMGKECADATGKGGSMSKDAMGKDAMRPGKMAAANVATGKDCLDASGKGAMKQDAMGKDAMKK